MRILIFLIVLTSIAVVLMPQAHAESPDADSITPQTSIPETSQLLGSKLELAKAWGLSIYEYDRYLKLKDIDSSFSDASISPLEVLGKYATGSEQKRYARMYHELYSENMRRTMSWLIAVQSQSQGETAFTRYDASPEIQNYLTSIGIGRDSVVSHTSPSPSEASQSVPPMSSQRIRLFIPFDCDDECAKRFHALHFQQSVGQYSGVDVIFAEAKNTDADLQHIREWATSQNITIEDVRSRKVTLNYDSESYRELRGDSLLPLAITWDGQTVR